MTPSPMTLDELIDTALQGTEGEALYDAYDHTIRTLQDARGQIHDVRANAVLDVLRQVLIFPRALSSDERSILEGLRTHS